ncbi:MAG: hypothetical protein IPP35_00100 [Elusimicrobia bacterium]|nr:hypothetical protein [Elusimicrobiota bacterium]
MRKIFRWRSPFSGGSTVVTGAGLVALAAGLLGLGVPVGASFSGPETCAACHPQEYDEWKPSVHAAAYAAPGFQKAWKQNGSKPSCLACHSTGAKGGAFAFPGVTCESCHGAMAEGHPGDKMPMPVSSDMCRTCHKKSYDEWKLSRHGQKNIRCFDCHKVHAQGLRVGGGDALCGSCHAAKMIDFAHATHHQEGLRCWTCHFPASSAGADALMGTGAPAHNLSVGAEVCARCHEDTVHKSARLTDLRRQVSENQKEMTVAGVKSVFDLNEHARDLQWRLDRARQSLWLVAILGFLAGAGLGWLAAWIALRPKK